MAQKNRKLKYSEMLMQTVEEFDKLLPNKLTFEDVLEVGIEAWNLANNKEFLMSANLYEKELECHKHKSIIEKMIDFKLDRFPESTNVIIDYKITENTLQVKTQTQENRLYSLMSRVINKKPKDI